MARRSDHTREELAALVIAAAQRIAASDGASHATMRRIATDIGYAAGSIYNAVGDIHTVLLRVNAATLDQLGDCLESAMTAPDPTSAPATTALSIADAYMDFVTTNGRLWAAVLEHRPAAAGTVPDWYAGPRSRLLAIVGCTIAPLYPDPDKRRRAVVALWAALQGVASLAAGGNLDFAAAGTQPRDIARSIVLRYLSGTEDPYAMPAAAGSS